MSSGNVGIGVTNPGQKLQIDSGNIQLSSGQQLQWGGGDNAIFGHDSNNYVQIKTDSTDRVKITSAGLEVFTGNVSGSATSTGSFGKLGVGINHCISDAVGENIDQPFTDIVSEVPGYVSRNALCAALISQLIELLDSYESTGFIDYQDEWQQCDITLGKKCTIQTGKKSITGMAMGIDSHGAIILRTEDGEEIRFVGGNLSLRLAQ